MASVVLRTCTYLVLPLFTVMSIFVEKKLADCYAAMRCEAEDTFHFLQERVEYTLVARAGFGIMECNDCGAVSSSPPLCVSSRRFSLSLFRLSLVPGGSGLVDYGAT